MDDLQNELEHIERRARRYWFEDGVAEIVSGLIFAIVGLYFVAEQPVRRREAEAGHSVLLSLLSVLFPVLVVALAFAARKLIPVLKDRYVHPRTGYIAFRRRKEHRFATAALAFALSGLLALTASRVHGLHEWLPALQGGVMGVAFLWVGRRAQLLRFPLEGLFAVVVGTAVAFLHLEGSLDIAILYGSLGVVLFVSGIIAFAGYLRHAPPPEQP